jgi:asparagine synthetase B (glutamine-hydrolysing)
VTRSVPVPDELEVLANLMLGPDENAEPLGAANGGDARGALDRVLAEALARPPCFVSFSGGRDSSAVLALACDTARRHGLAMPIPATMRFPAVPLSDETRWQELVLKRVGLRAEIVTMTDELDALGDAATDVLRRHGLRWPFNAYMHRPLIKLARGGTILTGVGGDELLGTTAPRRSPRQLTVAALPRALRAEIVRRWRPPDRSPWLTPGGQARVDRALASEEVASPYRWDRALRRWYASRAFAAMNGTLALIAAPHDVVVLNPLLDRQVLAELAELAGRRGFPSRTEAMQLLCGELLPEQILSRPTKAAFGAALWGPAAREFLSSWSGDGVDLRYVDPDRLKAELQAKDPDVRGTLLLHQAWLSSTSS